MTSSLENKKEMEQETTRPRLIWKISKYQVFESRMAEWMNRMSYKKRRRLTSHKLISKATEVCQQHYYKFERLPENWMERIVEEYELKLKDDGGEQDTNVTTTTGRIAMKFRKVYDKSEDKQSNENFYWTCETIITDKILNVDVS